jgi:hypothetical protein
MQTTPLEAQDVLDYLKASGRWTEELRATLRETVRRFRLDHDPGNGKRSFLRRTYDCPFFAGGQLGCTIPSEVKPYGCLGFNAAAAAVTAGEGCHSDQALLARQDSAASAVDHRLGVSWEKLPLPLALLQLA